MLLTVWVSASSMHCTRNWLQNTTWFVYVWFPVDTSSCYNLQEKQMRWVNLTVGSHRRSERRISAWKAPTDGLCWPEIFSSLKLCFDLTDINWSQISIPIYTCFRFISLKEVALTFYSKLEKTISLLACWHNNKGSLKVKNDLVFFPRRCFSVAMASICWQAETEV